MYRKPAKIIRDREILKMKEKIDSDVCVVLAWVGGVVGIITLIPLMIAIYYVVGNVGAQLLCCLCALIVITSFCIAYVGIIGVSENNK